MGTMTAPVSPTFLNVPLDVLVNRDLDKNGLDLLETLHKTSAALSSTASADMLLEPVSKKQKLQSEQPVDSAEAALLRAGRKKPPWTPTEQAVVAIKHCELGNRWTQIAAYLPLRSENDVKNIWHSTLRCKDTQKRSFLRTYALAVHDHAYDYATRKAMFDIAVRQCGPPPPQASEMIARVQLLMDHPELQAAVQQHQHMQQQEQQLLQQQQQQQDQLTQLSQLLQKRDELQQHQQLAHLAQLTQLQQQHPQLLLLQQHDGDAPEGDELDQNETEPRKSVAVHAKVNDQGLMDVRRLLQTRDKFGSGKYEETYGDSYATVDRAVDDALASELEQRAHLSQMQGQGQGALRNQASEPLDTIRANSDSGVSALRRYALQGQAGSSSGGGAVPPAAAGYSGPQADALPTALANMAAAAAAAAAGELQGCGTGGGGAAAAATGGDALPGASRQPGVQLPALGNLLALLYKYNIEQTQGKPMGPGDWPVNGSIGEEEEGGRAPLVDGQVPIGGGDGNGAAMAAAASPPDVDNERGSAKAAGVPTTNATNPSPLTVSTSMATGSPGAQSLALRSLALRPLQPKRERELDVKDEDEEGGEGMPSNGERVAGDSPKRPASVRVAARRQQQQQQAAAAAAAQQLRDNGSGGAAASQPGAGPRNRGAAPYTFQDADADELGAVEALALAARLNTSNVRTTASGPGNGRTSGSNLAAGGNNSVPGGAEVARLSGQAIAAAAAAAAAFPAGAAAASVNVGSLRNGSASLTRTPGIGTAATTPGAAILDLHARPPTASSQVQPPPPSRTLMRPSSDLHSPALQRQQQQQQQQLQQRSASQTLDVISVLNMPGLRRQVLSLPAQTLVALLCSPAFGSDAEASVLLLVALWLQANKEKVTSEQARAVCGAVRLAALGGFYLSAVLPQLLTEPRVGAAAGKAVISANARPGGRWFEMRHEELAFLTRYVHAGAAERALLADVARGVYDCSLPWYDMTPRYLGSPAEGFSFEWHIPEQGLRDALSNGTQPHASFTVNDDISDSDGGSAEGSVAVVPYILCRGLEWHVFVDCQQHRRGTGPGGASTGAGSSSVAGVFVYCRVPAALRSPGPATSGFVGVVPGAGIRLGVHGWRCGRLEEVFVWTFGDETYFVPDAGMGCPSALPLRKRPSSPPGSGGRGSVGSAATDASTMAWADYLHEGGLRGTLTFLPH